MVTTENCFNQGFIAFSIKLKELTSLDFDSFRATKLIFGGVLIIVALPFFPKCEKHFSVAALIQVTIVVLFTHPCPSLLNVCLSG